MDYITKDNIISAIKRFDKEGLPDPSADSQYYDLLFEENRYPPKVIVSYANYYAAGKELDRKSFSGGIGSKSFKLLERHGFEIVKKIKHNNETRDVKVWVEKTIVKGKPARVEGDRAVGKAIWSPRKSKGGGDIYKNMREVKQGDVILHLIDNSHFSGISIVKNNGVLKVEGTKGTVWDVPSYLHELDGYIEFGEEVYKDEILNDKYQEKLDSINNQIEVFYTYELKLRQGAYLTPCNIELFEIINDVYKAKINENIPYYDLVTKGQNNIEYALNRYIDHCNNSNWISDEKYKWNFSSWVNSRVDFKNQNKEDILDILISSQDQKYYEGNNTKGVNFILSGQRYSDAFITLKDVQYMSHLLDDSWDGGEIALTGGNGSYRPDMSFPKLSVWLTIFDPLKFKPYANNELSAGVKYLFNLDDNHPKKGFKAFVFAMEKISKVEQKIRQNEILSALFRNALGKEKLTNLDWAWIAQDLVLYTTRELCSEKDSDVETISNEKQKFWLYAPGRNASKWNECVEKNIAVIGWDELGDLNQYNDKEAISNALKNLYGGESSKMNDTLACYEFSKVIHEGDIIIPKQGKTTYLGYGIVKSPYRFEANRDEFKHVIDIEWHNLGKYEENIHPIALKTLTDISKYPDYVNRLKELIMKNDSYSKTDALRDLFIDKQDFQEILDIWSEKKNIILQGAPGTGKTFLAKRLAYALNKSKNKERLNMIQFHQSYSYEDFVQGIRPNNQGDFRLQNGKFYELCKKAEQNINENYVLIIDEINRGNLSKIFGELLMLIESDKRGEQLDLTYSPDEKFSVPKNLYILGTMNTADRSIAMVDYALRRRFSFFDINPQIESKKFSEFLISKGVKKNIVKIIKKRLSVVNEKISSEVNNLGKGYQIGHSYFCPRISGNYGKEWYNRIIKYDVEPLLREYWFDNPSEVKRILENLIEK